MRLNQIELLEREIDQERHMADNLVSAMQPALRERYIELKTANLQYQRDLEGMNQTLDGLNSKKAVYEDELSVSAVKREAVQLFEQLRAAEIKRDDLVKEEQVLNIYIQMTGCVCVNCIPIAQTRPDV